MKSPEMSPELEPQPKQSLLDQVEVRFVEGDKYYAHVPIHLINQEEVPVDEAHVEELAELMLKHEELSSQEAKDDGDRNGQQSDITVAYIEGDESLHIIDGFHRVPALEKNGAETAKCVILTDITMEDVIDLRISAANSHQSIKLSRIIEWINEAWDMTPWSETLTASQAFTLIDKNRSGVMLTLSEKDVEEIKELVQQKADKWGMAVSTLSGHLSMATHVDPKLIKKMLNKSGGGKLTSVSSGHVEKIGKELSEMFEHQNLVADYTVENNLTKDQTGVVAKAIAAIEDVDEARGLINDPEWKKALLENPAKPNIRRKKVMPKPTSIEKLESRYVLSELEVCRLAIENKVLSGKYVALPLMNKKKPVPIIYSPQDVPEPAKPFPWSGHDRKNLDIWLATLQDQGLRIAEKKPGSLDQQTTKDTVDATKNRILDDIRNGVLLYSGIESKQLLAKLYLVCLDEEIQHRIKKSNMQSPQTKYAEIPKEIEQATLNKLSFKNAIVGTKDTQQRRVLALTAMFKLPAFAIGQILDMPKPRVRSLQNQSIIDLGFSNPTAKK